MNKKLLVLLPIAMLALAGCNTPAEGGGNTPGGDEGGGEGGGNTPGGSEVTSATFNKEGFANVVEEGKTYPTEAGEVVIGGVTFAYSNGTGVKTTERSGGNYYYEAGALQWAKQGHNKYDAGGIANKTALDITTINVQFLSTYNSQAAQYFPQVSSASAVDGDFATVNPNETAPMDGVTITDAKQYVNNDNTEAQVYRYAVTFTAPAGHKFFKVTAGAGAFYPLSVVFSK